MNIRNRILATGTSLIILSFILIITIGKPDNKGSSVVCADILSDQDYPVWIDMMEQDDVNINDAREAFESYWEQNVHFRGDRSKQFEQWYT